MKKKQQKEMTSQINNSLKFYGEPPLFLILSFLVGGLIIFLPWLGLFLAGGILVKIILLVMLVFIISFVLKNTIFYVVFREKDILLRKISGEKIISYNEILDLRYNKEGFIPLEVVKVRSKKNKKKLFHFFVSKNNRKTFARYIEEKGFKIFEK